MAQSGLCPATRHNNHKNTNRIDGFLGGRKLPLAQKSNIVTILKYKVMFLSKEEGGHGVVDITSSVATFRLQFLQMFLTGYLNVWRDLAGLIFKRADEMGLDNLLFSMDTSFLNTTALAHFYCEFF